MYCGNCGKLISNDSTECMFCHEKVEPLVTEDVQPVKTNFNGGAFQLNNTSIPKTTFIPPVNDNIYFDKNLRNEKEKEKKKKHKRPGKIKDIVGFIFLYISLILIGFVYITNQISQNSADNGFYALLYLLIYIALVFVGFFVIRTLTNILKKIVHSWIIRAVILIIIVIVLEVLVINHLPAVA